MIQKKNLLFLDIDGVLNCNRTYHASMHLLPPHPLNDESLCRREVTTLDPIAVNMLKRLCMDSHVEIVISSTWRFNYTIEQFKDIFAYYGLGGSGPDYGLKVG